jgi:hypothetical protein
MYLFLDRVGGRKSLYTAFLNSGMRATREDERDDEDDDKEGQCAFV